MRSRLVEISAYSISPSIIFVSGDGFKSTLRLPFLRSMQMTFKECIVRKFDSLSVLPTSGDFPPTRRMQPRSFRRSRVCSRRDFCGLLPMFQALLNFPKSGGYIAYKLFPLPGQSDRAGLWKRIRKVCFPSFRAMRS